MKKNVLKSSISGFVVGLGALLIPCTMTVAAVPSAHDECAKELLLSYFPEPIVEETLKKFNVPQDKFAGIQKSLANKDKEVVKTVEQKASAMNPNPLKDPQQRQAAVKLFRETLLQVFSDALKENGLQDASQYQPMLDDIQQQKAKKFAMCMEKQKAQMQKPAAADDKSHVKDNADSDEDSDDDESDDEDEDSDEEPAKLDVKVEAVPESK